MYATGLAILGSHVYWTDNRQHALLRADKETGAQLDILEENLEIPMSVVAFSRNVKPGTKIKVYYCVYVLNSSFLPTRSFCSKCDNLHSEKLTKSHQNSFRVKRPTSFVHSKKNLFPTLFHPNSFFLHSTHFQLNKFSCVFGKVPTPVVPC